MPNHNTSNIKQNSRRSPRNKNSSNHPYVCRLCRYPHPLRKCKRFLGMNTTNRLQIVHTYGYCKNCLAHTHSQGSCFTKTGCRYCHHHHHSLLHTHPRLQQKNHKESSQKPSSRSQSKPKVRTNEYIQLSKVQSENNVRKTKLRERDLPPKPQSVNTSLSAIFKQNVATLLPTVVVQIDSPIGKCNVRCLLDSGSKFSCLSSKTVEKLDLTTLTLDEETICPITLCSVYDSEIKIEATLRMNNRISIHTPEKSIPKSLVKNFHNILLADAGFYKTAPVDIILGVDIYSRVISEGVLNRPGLPAAQNTLFGWTLYGTCSI